MSCIHCGSAVCILSAIEYREAITSCHIPSPDHPGINTEHMLSIGAKDYSSDSGRMSVPYSQTYSPLNLPEMNALIITSAGQKFSVSTESKGTNLTGVPL